MKRMLVVLLLVITSAASFAAPDNAAVRRFGLFIGANNGGNGRGALRYAVRDAESTSRLFTDMGGIRHQDNFLLVEPSLKELMSKLNVLQGRIVGLKGKYSRLEFVFYYSGHSDEEGLLLSRDKFAYRELKETIKKMPVDMRVVILDSCSSGALTKLKGGNKNPPFLMDSSIKTEGYAFMTSSSSDEASQESEMLKGSYFTYALLSGLRGAADNRGDGRVTLNQAYQYAYSETLAKTERTLGGAQHPNYDIQMNGAGDVVLTDLRETSASLKFATDISGRLSIRDESGILMAEINKEEAKTVELGLEPGEYRITVSRDKKTHEGNIALNDGEHTVFTKSMLVAVENEVTVSRGNNETPVVAPDTNSRGAYVNIPFSFSIVPIISTMKTIVNFQMNIGAGFCDMLEGTSVGFVNITGEDAKFIDLGLVSIVGRDFRGYQGTLVSINGRNFSGGQTSLASIVGNDFDGFQGSLVNLVVGNFRSAQLGLVNFVGGNFDGFRAGLVNITGNQFKGFEAGLVNAAWRSFEGPQIGLVNFSDKMKGVQIGLVNYAGELDGVSVGLVSIVAKNGQTHGQIWIDETGFVNAALIHGSKLVYNIYHIGMDVNANLWTYGFGLGVHLPFDPFYANIEVLGSSISHISVWDGNNTVTTVRAYLGFSVFEHLSFIAGASLRYFHSWYGSTPAINPFYNAVRNYDDNSKLWPGVFVGVAF